MVTSNGSFMVTSNGSFQLTLWFNDFSKMSCSCPNASQKNCRHTWKIWYYTTADTDFHVDATYSDCDFREHPSLKTWPQAFNMQFSWLDSNQNNNMVYSRVKILNMYLCYSGFGEFIWFLVFYSTTKFE